MLTTQPVVDASPTEPVPSLYEVNRVRLYPDKKEVWLWLESRQVWMRYHLVAASS
jgi:hypothetical protein